MHNRCLVQALAVLARAIPVRADSAVVVPGVSIGSLRLGATRDAVHKLRGKPTRTAKTHRGGTADSWRLPNSLLETEVVYRSGRAVQSFYDWYVMLSGAEAESTACMRAVKSRTEWFRREVREGLAEDAAAQAKNETPGRLLRSCARTARHAARKSREPSSEVPGSTT